jgi:hypothetical protein
VLVKRLLVGIGAVATVAGAWMWFSAPAKDDPKLFANRVWAERSPRDARDLVAYLVPLEVAGKRGGVIQRASRYAFRGERFGWKRDGSTLTLEFPQDQRTAQLKYRTWTCGKGEAPEGFELCLELSQGNEKIRLFSRKGWRVPKGEDLPVFVPELEELPACEGCVAADLGELYGGL